MHNAREELAELKVRLKVKFDCERWKKLDEKSAITSELAGKAEEIKYKSSQKLIRFQRKFTEQFLIKCHKTQDQRNLSDYLRN